MVKVQVGDKIEEWPASRKGALGAELSKLAEKHKVKTYKELIEKIKYIPSAET
jgi:ribosomal protein L20A (L18A)